MQIIPDVLRGERGLVVCAGGGHEGEALAVGLGAGAASVPDVEGGAGEEEDLSFNGVADAVGTWTRHECLLLTANDGTTERGGGGGAAE